MLYVGHFSFTIDETEEQDASHGVFTCVAEADDVETALDKLRDLIVRMKEQDDTLEGVRSVYLDSCIEIMSMPEAGMMTYWVAWPQEDVGSISTGIRWAEEDEAVGYGMVPFDADEGEDEGDGEDAGATEAEGDAAHVHDESCDHGHDEDEEYEVEPFVEF